MMVPSQLNGNYCAKATRRYGHVVPTSPVLLEWKILKGKEYYKTELCGNACRMNNFLLFNIHASLCHADGYLMILRGTGHIIPKSIIKYIAFIQYNIAHNSTR